MSFHGNYPMQVGLSTLLLLTLFSGLAIAQVLERAIITHSSESISITPLIYGIEKGFYRKEGVDLQFRILRGDLAVSPGPD
jgi:ABC-type nitrate/sulfonate/bicarbonate transport system substrate-binding protein